MSDIWLGQRPRTKPYSLKLPKELYRTRVSRAPGGMRERLMFRFESDFARLLAISVLTLGAVSIVAIVGGLCLYLQDLY